MIRTQEHGPVRELRLDRPPANALTPELLQELCAAVDAAEAEGVRGLVLSGSPGMFTGGLDVPYLLGLDRDRLRQAVAVLFDLVQTLVASPVPVAAAITGHSPAAGAVLALCCDRRIMADGEHVIGVNEVKVGLPMPEVVLALLARQVGARHAEEMTVTGRLLSPAEALAIGLVDEVVPLEQVVERAVAWLRDLAATPAYAVRTTRQAARRDLVASTRRLAAIDARRFPEEWFRPEVQAGLNAMVAALAAKGARSPS
jgi:enoyl-CoA hydratase/carnithine racemase